MTSAKTTKKRSRKVPKTAAVAFTCPEGKYSEMLMVARQNINPADMKIDTLKVRRAANGGIIYEVSGEDKEKKADLLAAKMKEVLAAKEGVRVTRPCKKGELRVLGLDETATAAEVATIVANIGECSLEDIKTNKVRFNRGTMGTIWVQCPIKAAEKLVAMGSIRVGWVTAKIESLKARPLQCYRCLERGHVREVCSDPADRTNCCYNCGSTEHKANNCKGPTRCILCTEAGKPANHRVGGDSCPFRKKRVAKVKGGQAGKKEEKKKGDAPAKQVASSPTSSSASEAPEPRRKLRTRASMKKEENAAVTKAAKNTPPKEGEPMEVVVEEAN